MRAVDEQIENDGKHPADPGRPDERYTPFTALLDERVAMTHFLDLLGSDLMAPNVTAIPRIPDQAANFDHTDAV